MQKIEIFEIVQWYLRDVLSVTQIKSKSPFSNSPFMYAKVWIKDKKEFWHKEQSEESSKKIFT